jgi:hypothetical protein
MNKLTAYLEQYALLALEKQEKFAKLVREHMSELDLDSGKVIFDSGLTFPFQVLGTESDNTLTWLWAWAEEQTEIPEDLLTSSLRLKDWGKQEGIEEFTIPSVDLSRADGHVLSLISSQISSASCYYRSPSEGGAVFILIFSEVVDRQPPFGLDGLSRQFIDLISRYDFNHRNALVSYLRANNLSFTEKGPFVSAKLVTGEKLIAEFDGQGQLKNRDGEKVS